MQHPFPAPRLARRDQRVALVLPTVQLAAELVAVAVQRWPAETRVHAQGLVRIDEQQVVRLRPRQRHCLVAVMGEIAPRTLMQFPGTPRMKSRMMSCVPSVEPVSTMTQRSIHGLTEAGSG